jgi:hypothetical protein
MSKEFEGIDDIKDLFNQILGSEVIIKDNIDATEEGVFIVFIKKLEEAYNVENQLFDIGGLELAKITDPLWFVLENSFKFLYGEEAADLIWWYIFDRFNPDGSVVPLEDENGKEYIFKDAKDLWSYIKYRFPQDSEE